MTQKEKPDEQPEEEKKTLEIQEKSSKKSKEEVSLGELILKRLQKGPWSIPGIAKELETSEEEAVRLVDVLYRKGHEIVHNRETKSISLSSDPTQLEAIRIDPNGAQDKKRKEILRHVRKIGVIHGTVLGSKYSNPTLLATLKEKFEEEGVDFVIHLGDVITGRLTGKRAGESFLASDPEVQAEYVLNYYPHSKIFKTYMISGTRDLTFKSRRGSVVNIIRRICSDDRRSDLIYRGDLSTTFHVKGVRIEVINPGEDYAPYSKSYPLQNIITSLISEEESLLPQEEDDAVIVLLGGSHVYDKIKSGDIHGVLVPSLQSLTPYQKGKRKRGSGPVVGACIIELYFDDNWKLKRNKGREGIKIRPIKLKKYQRKNDYQAKVEVNPDLPELHQKVLRLFDTQSCTEGEISRLLKIHKEKVWEIVGELKGRGYQILTPKDPEKLDTKQFELKHKMAMQFAPLPLKEIFAEKFKVAFVSDTHFGSLDQLWSCVKTFYEICDEEGINIVLHAGDWTAGDFNHPANNHKVFIPSTEGQMRFLADWYPKLKKGKTKGISGNHDEQHGSKKGFDALRSLFIEKREDVDYLGRNIGFTKLGKSLNVELLHPSGGPGYSLSYKGQNIVESEIRLNRARRKKDKIHILALGNWHVYNEQFHSEVFVVCVPCFQEQTEDYMKPKGLDPWIGGLIYEFVTDKDGYITEVSSEFVDMAHMAKTPDFPEVTKDELFDKYFLLK